MSEELKNIEVNPTNHEHQESNIQKKSPEKEMDKVEQKTIDIDDVHDEIERQHPLESNQVLEGLNLPAQEDEIIPPDNELKRIELNNNLIDIRGHLSALGSSFSKIIHQPTINRVSEFSGKTIVRPTAILFGGLFMFIGSTVYLYATYSTNARYNFFVAIFLFLGGFFAGIIIELLYNLFFKRNIKV